MSLGGETPGQVREELARGGGVGVEELVEEEDTHDKICPND
jgi:hypothetical protein